MTRKSIWARVKYEHGNLDAYFNNHRTKRVKKPTKPKLRVVSNNDDYDDEETELTTAQGVIGLLVLLSLIGLLVWGVWSIVGMGIAVIGVMVSLRQFGVGLFSACNDAFFLSGSDEVAEVRGAIAFNCSDDIINATPEQR